MSRAIGPWGLALAVAVCGVIEPAGAALPPVQRLFGCPIASGPEAFTPPKGWSLRLLPALGARVHLPPGWRVQVEGALAVVESPGTNVRLALRRGRLAGADRLDFVRRSVELTELGPSHAGARCEAAVVAALTSLTGWRQLRFGVHGRPLGERQRSWSLFLALGDGALTSVVTVRWRRRDAGPDLAIVRQLLGGIQPL